MRFALLGTDEDLMGLARWLAARSDHSVDIICDADVVGTQLDRLFPAARVEREWDSLLEAHGLDAVLVAGRKWDTRTDDRRAEQLRRLVQNAVPLVVMHPVCEAIVAIELEMIRRDVRGVLLPFHPLLLHPRVRQLIGELRWQRDGPLGTLEQITVDRALHDRSPASVLSHLARDALLIAQIAGTIKRVGAMSGAGDPSSLASLSVHLACESVPITRWSAGPVGPFHGAVVTLIGSSGVASLRLPADGAPPKLSGPNTRPPAADSSWSAPCEMIRLLEACRTGQSPPVTWDEACRAIEVTEAAELSCQRGRHIELHMEKVTELDTFKGLMSAGGCGMLLWVLVVVTFVGMVEALLPAVGQRPLWKLWPVLLIAPLFVFLALQLLRLVFTRSDR